MGLNVYKQTIPRITVRTVLVLLLCLTLSSVVNAKPKSNVQTEFLQAYKALNKGRLYASPHLKNYTLYPYLEYERLKRNLKTSSTKALIEYTNKNPRSWMAEDLNAELLVRLEKQKQWGQIRKHYKKGQGGNKAKCIGLEAQIRTQASSALYQEALRVWKSGNRRPRVCNSLFSLLKRKGLINDASAWERITLAMEKGRTSLARDLSKHLKEPKLVNLWISLRKNPNNTLKKKRLSKNDARSRQLIAYGIKRAARKNTSTARKHWIKFQKSHAFTAQEKADVESYIGVRDAQNHSPYALQKFAAIPQKMRSDDASKWMARMALRQGDWRNLRSAIDGMPAETKNKERWQYWRAHSNKRLGNKAAFQQQLAKIAHNASFYGFLAADELKKPYVRLSQKEKNWQQLTPRIKKLGSIQRATELFAIGLKDLAKKEWFWTLKQLNKQDKLIAAAYALEINQPFMAIITVSQTKDWNQVGLRFPLEYKELVKQSARNHRIIPAWVYGIMRRESAFDSQIVSSANAKGLMQVLPSTAKGVAKKLGIKTHRTSDLLIPERNANLGAAYLSQMLKRFKGNYIKATAAYNAGPHRIPRWTPDYKLSAPRWIESIPFNETRDYVRAVMSYTTIYDHKLAKNKGKTLRLSQRLQAVGPK